ncbi:hypothetical protein KI387_001120, partial [Taxus chinensis]
MEKSKPYLGLVVVQTTYAGMNILARLALKDGMSYFVFVTYRMAIATLAIHAPFAYVLERLEKVDIRSFRGQAKIFGTIVCVSGAMIMTFYKGPAIKFPSAHETSKLHKMSGSKDTNSNRLLGSILVYAGLASWSAWITFQTGGDMLGIWALCANLVYTGKGTCVCKSTQHIINCNSRIYSPQGLSSYRK